jgi:hypothetical protein
VLEVQVYEQPIVVNHHHVVNVIHLFLPIKPPWMDKIVLGLMDFDVEHINKANVASKL